MGYSQSFAISAAGMDLERLRVDVAALNLANANTPLDAAGGGYRPLHVVARPMAQQTFAAQFDRWIQPPSVTVEPSLQPPRQVMDPGHPLADANGLVSYPGVDHMGQMLTLMSAMRAYEANVVALNQSRAMAVKALEIGGAA